MVEQAKNKMETAGITDEEFNSLLNSWRLTNEEVDNLFVIFSHLRASKEMVQQGYELEAASYRVQDAWFSAVCDRLAIPKEIRAGIKANPWTGYIQRGHDGV